MILGGLFQPKEFSDSFRELPLAFDTASGVLAASW